HAITTTSERIAHSTKMHRSLAWFSGPEASNRTPSLADFITTTSGFRFSVHTAVAQEQCPIWVISGHFGLRWACPLYPRKQTSIGASLMSAVCHKQNFDQHSTYTIVGFARARSISRMSPWCTVAT